jgi:hypothetical protein
MKHILSAMAVLALAPTPAPAAQWTTATVEADRPFGKLDTSRAGRDFKGFWRGLSREERTEIRGRCSVIGNSARYQNDARALCSELRAEDTFDGGGGSGSDGNGGNGGGNGGGGAGTAGGRD